MVRGDDEALRAFLARHFVDRETSQAEKADAQTPWAGFASRANPSWIETFVPKQFDFNTVLSEPRDASDDDGRAWRIEHWGTKWNNGIEDSYLEYKPGELVFRVETAWDHPWPLMDALERMHPTLGFRFGCSLHDGLDGPDDCRLESFRYEENEDWDEDDNETAEDNGAIT